MTLKRVLREESELHEEVELVLVEPRLDHLSLVQLVDGDALLLDGLARRLDIEVRNGTLVRAAGDPLGDE